MFVYGGFSTSGRRPTNEDQHIAGMKINYGGQQCFYSAVFDGHGGADASEFCSSVVHSRIQEETKKKYPIQMAMQRAFCIVDREYIKKFEGQAGQEAGTTACVMINRNEAQNNQTIFIGNAGDSRAVLGHIDINTIASRSLTVKLASIKSLQSVDHKPSLPDERSRIEQYGSYVSGGTDDQDCARVAGMLAVSRAIGDAPLKQNGVIAYPDVFKIDGKQIEIAILACDGLWDIMSSEEALACVLYTIGYCWGIETTIEPEANEKAESQANRLTGFKTAIQMLCDKKIEDAKLKLSSISTKAPSDANDPPQFTHKDCKALKLADVAELSAKILAQMAVFLDSQDNVSVVVGLKDSLEKVMKE